ncbi:extensin family protein, partial [Sphingomonas bacterium]|uniref:extensin family protein n=1 Tax=Sphingomonas bacterium TaxID=1895847 RepID=UPI0020C724A6
RPVAGPPAGETRACHADLARMGVRFTPLPDRDRGDGCALIGTVRLDDIGVPVTNLTAVRCGEARALAGWVRNAVVPAAYQLLGSELARVEGMGSYACRNVIGSARAASRRSGHAIANAVDIGGFDLRDGRRITIAADWSSPDPQVRGFLDAIHRSACRRFGTVLSPDYNTAHRNHLHLEDDRASFCR